MTFNEQTLIEALGRYGERIEGHHPFPRFQTTRAGWRAMVDALASASHWSLLGIWTDRRDADGMTVVHAALRDDFAGEIGVISLDCLENRFPSLSDIRPAAIRPERVIAELTGIEPTGLTDTRPWLDHGTWGLRRPLAPESAEGPAAGPSDGEPYPILPVIGAGLHEIPVGPVHAGIIEPGHFRFTANGETVVRLEERLGYVHRGVEKLMAGKGVMEAAALACRISGDSAVAHSLAFSRAVEAALGMEIPPRAHWLRACMAELERMANHLGDIGAICNDAAFAFMLAELSVLREKTLRGADACFGHRLMMDRVVPGGVTADLTAEGAKGLREMIARIRKTLPGLINIYDGTASLQDRTVGTGIIASGLVNRFGVGGFIGRAAGRGQDARRSPAYAPYDVLEFSVPVLTAGDVNARIWIRIREVEQSLDLLERIIDRLSSADMAPGDAPPRIAPPTDTPTKGGCEGLAVVEGFRGEIMTWVRIADDGTVARCHPRDPSVFQWPLLEAAIEGNIVADFPLCNKSFNCSYAGHDL